MRNDCYVDCNGRCCFSSSSGGTCAVGNCGDVGSHYCVGDCISGFRIYQQQNEIIGQLASAFGVFHTFIFQRGKKEARNLALRSCFAQLLTVASYVIVCIRAVNGVYSIGAVVQYVGAIVQLSEGIRMLASSLQMIQIQAPFCKKFLDYIDIDEHSESEESGKKMLAPENVQEITFDHVYFSYKKDGNYVRNCEEDTLDDMGSGESGGEGWRLCDPYR